MPDLYIIGAKTPYTSREGKSFAFETTLSGLSYIELIKKASDAGYNSGDVYQLVAKYLNNEKEIINFEVFNKIR